MKTLILIRKRLAGLRVQVGASVEFIDADKPREPKPTNVRVLTRPSLPASKPAKEAA